IGMMIYQADQWPEKYRNKLFTLNMHGRRANVERLERNGSGYVGKHEPDVFLSDDPWFRGIEISTGPDGSGFILDWSDTGECHESTGVHRTSGRIFRVSYGEPKKPETPFAWRKPWPKADLKSPDEHARVLAIRELVQFSPIDALTGPLPNAVYPELTFDPIKMAQNESSAFVRLQLAATLQRLPLSKRPSLAMALAYSTDDMEDPFIPYMVWFGISPLVEHDPKAVVQIAKLCFWPQLLRWITRGLASKPTHLNSLLIQAKPDQIESILEGMSDAFKGIRKAPKPANWDKVASTSKSPLIRDLSFLFGDGRALDDVKKIALDDKADVLARESALKTLIENRPPDLREICTRLLEVRGVNVTAVRGLALFSDPEIGQKLVASYRKFAAGDRPAVIDTLVSRPAFAKALLKEMAAGKIPRADLSAFHARQINSLHDEALSKQLVEVWGELRESAADKKELIEKLKKQLTPETLAKAGLSQGRMLFTAVCGSCHAMYGQGGKIGPDLTGSGRANLDYLLENIADPSGVVSADFRMSLLTHKDGRILNGVVAESNDRTLTLRTLTETLTLERADIIKQETSPMSMMPEGLLLAFQPDQVRDLIAYLMHPVQVPMPKAAP
ncbi:MAG TPA: c-type cytochrome, partial [Prosthecobacter sp.]|nr:c-type cytochrome [Prosthecobacter sp.]